MGPASLSVLVLVPIAMKKFRRYSVCFPFQNFELSFFKIMQVFEVFVVLLNRKRCRIMYADYVICNFAHKLLMAKNQTYEKTNDGPMKRLSLDFVCEHCVELKSSTNFGSSQSLFVKFWVQQKSFAKSLSRAKVQNVLKSS